MSDTDVKEDKISNSRLRINILTSGRFHVLDLARELHHLGHDVAFYSYLPLRRCVEFGLPPKCHRNLLRWVFPLVLCRFKAPQRLQPIFDKLLRLTLDRVAAIFLEPCDVFVGMSGLCVCSAIVARQKYHAKIFIERGSSHILSQKEILEQIPGVPNSKVSKFDVARESWGYEFADVISVPSNHVEQSFQERGIAQSKLFRNPYGVDLSLFTATEFPHAPPTAIFVGEWSLRKGCDVLWDACRVANSWHLLHVGGLGDAPVPRHPLFTHHESVPQMKLPEFYRQAHVFVHASREEGLSLVQAQALACGLPLVCTDRTGGEDLRELLDIPKWVIVVPADNVAALGEGVARAFVIAASQQSPRDILGGARAKLSWSQYGRRYHNELLRRFDEEQNSVF